jgi:hypothetical protein
MMSIPPAAVMPETAFVTDIKGEWREGFTPHTTWYPTTPPRVKVVNMFAKAGSGETMPMPSRAGKAAEMRRALDLQIGDGQLVEAQ